MKNPKALFLSTLGAAFLVGACAFFFASGDAEKGSQISEKTSDFRKALSSKQNPSRNTRAQAGAPKAMSKAQSPLIFALSPKLAKPLQTPVPVGVDPKTLPRAKTVLSTTVVDVRSLPNLATLKKGQVIGLPLPDGRSYDGRVNLVKPAQGMTRVGGSLMPASAGSFSISQKGQTFRGLIRLPAENLGYVIETQDNGQVVMQEHFLSDLQCMGMPVDPTVAAEQEAAQQGAGPEAAAPMIPLLDSLPGATAVIYLDFDGETVTDTDWNDGDTIYASAPLYNGQPLTSTHITQVWQAVAEDYAPFSVSVTTDQSRYDNAPIGERMRCIITPTKEWFDSQSAAGVAYLDSFSEAGTAFDDDIPCWCFGIYEPASMALVISHEVGHTFGLAHDGRTSPAQVYYSGHGTGAASWGPIMGAAYGRTMTQWSQGEYNNADNTEDDVAIIAAVVGFITDEALNNTVNAAVYNPADGVVSLKGLVTSQNDPDFYKLVVKSAPLTLTCAPNSTFPNVDATLRIYDSGGGLIVQSSPTTSLSATISLTIPADGTYYIAVYPSGNGSAATGYTNYGSIGGYSITGSFTAEPSTPVFTLQPLPVSVTEGGTAILTAKAITTGGLALKWWKDGADSLPNTAAYQSATLKLSAIKPAQAGLYKLRAVNTTDATNFWAFSDEVLVTVNLKPKIITQPLPWVAVAGTDHTFTVVAEGTNAGNELKYTWERTSKPVVVYPQSSSPDLSLTGITLADAGSYRVKVTNATGIVVTSKVVTLKVDSPPVITLQPVANTAIATGATATLKVAVVGKAPFTYKWYKEGTVDPINTSNTPTLAVKVAGTYHVEVFNDVGGVVGTISQDAVVAVYGKPVITAQPTAPAVVPTGGVTTVQLTVGATDGGGILLYQWQKDGKNISLLDNPTADEATLVFDPINWVNRGAYKVIVSNQVGVVISKTVTIAVNSTPVIITHPLTPTYGATGGSASFTVVAGGNPPLKYQWYRGDTSPANAIPKATAAKLTLTKLAEASEGLYICRVTDKDGANPVETIPAQLNVEDLPKITAITSNRIVLGKHKVIVNGSITLSATITGNVLTYQWMKAGKPIVGETAATLTFPLAQLTDSGSYSLVVTNNVGTAKSATLAMAVLLPPTITQVPVSLTALETFSVSLAIKATGSPTLKYQWEKILVAGVPATATEPEVPPVTQVVVGKTAPTLTFSKVKLSDAGSYRCVVKNDVGTAISLEALLSVNQIQPSVITQFLPRKGRVTSFVRLRGANLQHVISAKFGSSVAGLTLISDSEILLKVPTGPVGLTKIYLTSKGSGGTTESSLSFDRITTGEPNDLFQDAIIISGTAPTYQGNNTGFTMSGDGEWAGSSSNAWFSWEVPRSGTYRWMINAEFDSEISVYRGDPFGGYFGTTYAASSSYQATTGEFVTVTFTKGESVMIAIGGNSFNGLATQGPYEMTCTAVSLSMPTPESVNQEQDMEPVITAAPAATASQETSLGGNADATQDEVVLSGLTDADASASPLIITAFNMRLQSVEQATDTFGWTIYDVDGLPLAGLLVDSTDGALYETFADGSRRSLEQTLVSGSVHSFEVSVNQETSTWSASMDGVDIVTDASLPGSASFSEVCPVWHPSKDGSAHASMFFSDLRILKAPGK